MGFVQFTDCAAGWHARCVPSKLLRAIPFGKDRKGVFNFREEENALLPFGKPGMAMRDTCRWYLGYGAVQVQVMYSAVQLFMHGVPWCWTYFARRKVALRMPLCRDTCPLRHKDYRQSG